MNDCISVLSHEFAVSAKLKVTIRANLSTFGAM